MKQYYQSLFLKTTVLATFEYLTKTILNIVR